MSLFSSTNNLDVLIVLQEYAAFPVTLSLLSYHADIYSYLWMYLVRNNPLTNNKTTVAVLACEQAMYSSRDSSA